MKQRFLGPGADNGSRRWLYLAGCASGVVKVGVSYSPKQRMRQHHKTLGGVLWYHLFAGYTSKAAFFLERDAIRALGLIGKRVERTEAFREVDKAAAIACVRKVIHVATSNEKRWAEERIRNLMEFAERDAFSERRDICWIRQPITTRHPAPAPAEGAAA